MIWIIRNLQKTLRWFVLSIWIKYSYSFSSLTVNKTELGSLQWCMQQLLPLDREMLLFFKRKYKSNINGPVWKFDIILHRHIHSPANSSQSFEKDLTVHLTLKQFMNNKANIKWAFVYKCRKIANHSQNEWFQLQHYSSSPRPVEMRLLSSKTYLIRLSFTSDSTILPRILSRENGW